MKGTEHFEQSIQAYLNEVAAKDKYFAEKLANQNKSIKECCAYIISEVFRQNRNGFDDSEVFGMAKHYYDEENIKPGKMPSNLRVVTNHTEGEIEGAGEPIKQPKKPTIKKPSVKKAYPDNQYSMF